MVKIYGPRALLPYINIIISSTSSKYISMRKASFLYYVTKQGTFLVICWTPIIYCKWACKVVLVITNYLLIYIMMFMQFQSSNICESENVILMDMLKHIIVEKCCVFPFLDPSYHCFVFPNKLSLILVLVKINKSDNLFFN